MVSSKGWDNDALNTLSCLIYIYMDGVVGEVKARVIEK